MESPASRSEKASESVDNSSSSQDLLTSITGMCKPSPCYWHASCAGLVFPTQYI